MIAGSDAVQICKPDIHVSPPVYRRRRAFMKKRNEDDENTHSPHYDLYFGEAIEDDERDEENGKKQKRECQVHETVFGGKSVHD